MSPVDAPDLVEVTSGSFAFDVVGVQSTALQVYHATGVLAASAGADDSQNSVSVLQQTSEASLNGLAVLSLRKVSPLGLAKYCNALLKTEAMLLTVKPSLGTVFLCPQHELPKALAALLGCGCDIQLPGSSPCLPLSFASRHDRTPTTGAGGVGAWSSANGGGFLRLQAAGLFVEVPFFKAQEKCLVSIEASRAGIFHPESGKRSTVMAVRGAQLFDGGEAWDEGTWKRLETHHELLAMELISPERRGVWLFVGRHFARLTEGRPDPLSPVHRVHSFIPDFEVVVGQVTRPGHLERLSAEGVSSVLFDAESSPSDAVRFKDGLCEHLVDGVTQRWKVLEMTFNPFEKIISKVEEIPVKSTPHEVKRPRGYPPNSKVKYWSVTVQRWIPATVHSQNQDGTYRLDLKKRAQPHHLRWPDAQAGDLPPVSPERPVKVKTGQKKRDKDSPIEDDTSSSSKAKRKVKKKKKTNKEKKKEKKVTSSSESEASSASGSESDGSSEGDPSSTSESPKHRLALRRKGALKTKRPTKSKKTKQKVATSSS